MRSSVGGCECVRECDTEQKDAKSKPQGEVRAEDNLIRWD